MAIGHDVELFQCKMSTIIPCGLASISLVSIPAQLPSFHHHGSTGSPSTPTSRHRMGPKTDRCQCHVIASKHRPSFFCNNMIFKEEDGHGHGRKGRCPTTTMSRLQQR